MSINRHQLTERLSALLDELILQKIVFEPSVDLNLAAFQGLKALIDMGTGTEFDLLIKSEALRRPTAMVAPRHVKLAVEFIKAHPEQL